MNKVWYQIGLVEQIRKKREILTVLSRGFTQQLFLKDSFLAGRPIILCGGYCSRESASKTKHTAWWSWGSAGSSSKDFASKMALSVPFADYTEHRNSVLKITATLTGEGNTGFFFLNEAHYFLMGIKLFENLLSKGNELITAIAV